MSFFSKNSDLTAENRLPGNESGKISLRIKLLRLLIAIGSGVLLAMAFPPLNLSALAFVAFVPNMILAMSYIRKRELFLLGYLQGVFWGLFSFWWLREINYAIPFMLSAILGLWFGVFMLFVRLAHRGIWLSMDAELAPYEERKKYILSWYRELFFAIVTASFFPCLEYIRIQMFPWNFIGVSQYKALPLIQIAEYTGIYGITYLIMLVNAVFASTIIQVRSSINNGKRCNLYAAMIVMVILGNVILFGTLRMRMKNIVNQLDCQTVNFGVVQGDISQRRHADQRMAEEALVTYAELSKKLLNEHPEVDIVIWPETAVPYPYFGAHDVSKKYRYQLSELITRYRKKFLIGSLDFYFNRATKEYELTNAALLFDIYGRNVSKYEKIHRVPFGEFIPFRKFLPDWVIKTIDMGRDLRAGTVYDPMQLRDNVRAGMAVCYESIFASLCRRERQLGANIFLAISNDAWYPTSSEPEQHIANAVFRMVENGISALRIGNNGGTVLINYNGEIVKSLLPSPIDRGQAYGVISAEVPKKTAEMTFYTKFGDVFLGILFIISLIGIGFCSHKELKFKKIRSFGD